MLADQMVVEINFTDRNFKRPGLFIGPWEKERDQHHVAGRRGFNCSWIHQEAGENSNRPHHAADSGGHLLPVGALDHEALASGRSKTVVASTAVGGGSLPFSGNEPAPFEAVERGIKRAVVDGENIIRHASDRFGNFVAVCTADGERS
jgi:hypothetical protein